MTEYRISIGFNKGKGTIVIFRGNIVEVSETMVGELNNSFYIYIITKAFLMLRDLLQRNNEIGNVHVRIEMNRRNIVDWICKCSCESDELLQEFSDLVQLINSIPMRYEVSYNVKATALRYEKNVSNTMKIEKLDLDFFE